MSDRVGQQLGNYRLVRLLGRGGFAEVYLGEHLRLKSQAAIKVLHAQLADDDVEGFLTEAQTIARLVHPHIVRVFDFDVDGSIPFLVIDYASNGTLRQRHPKGVPLPLTTIISYVKQVADALQYAHDEKIIHRDIKPDNMLVGRRNEVMISDFGIATVAHSSRYQRVQDVAGTLAYMAPEQIQAHPRPASDQYALGVVVYEWLSGTPPFQGTSVELAAKHIYASPPSLCEKFPTLLPTIEEVVLKALAKDPKQRFGSVQTFATALEEASQGEHVFPVETRSPLQPTSPLPQAQPEQPLVVSEQANQTEQVSPARSHSITPLPLQQDSPVPPLMEQGSPSEQHPSGTSLASLQPGASFPSEVSRQTILPSKTERILPSQTEPVSPSRELGGERFLPLPNLVSAARIPRPQRGPFWGKVALLITLILLTAGSASLLYTTINNEHANFQATATAKAGPMTTVMAGTYDTAVAANGVMYGFDAQHTHVNPYEKILNPANVSHLKLNWTASTGDAINSSPAVANGVVYLGSFDGKVYAFNASTGRSLWTASTGARILSSPAVANGIVYIGSWDDKVYAFNASTGQTLWTASTGHVISSSPTVAHGVVYIGSGDDRLYAFNASTGQTLWTASTGKAVTSSPAIANDIVYVGSGDGKLYAFNASTGASMWIASTSGIIYSSPAVAHGIVYVGSWDDKLYAFDASTGQTLWTTSTGALIGCPPTVANGVVYVGSDDHSIHAFDASTGLSLWSASTGNSVVAEPAVANGVVYVGSWDHSLYAFHLPDTSS